METAISTMTLHGRVHFMRSEVDKQACVCCPAGGGHIFSRQLVIDEPAKKGSPKDVFDLLYTAALRNNSHEGKRVRVTVEVLDEVPGPASDQ
ncbi:hypothetical protein ABIC83_002891 [Roseateles asaccharophilus]|uniref:hypothetical protein n=1 Tax=Roseateles asaccharophilus TaxID=582607 RepID=UPI003838D295